MNRLMGQIESMVKSKVEVIIRNVESSADRRSSGN
jgi:hypothetical protein